MTAQWSASLILLLQCCSPQPTIAFLANKQGISQTSNYENVPSVFRASARRLYSSAESTKSESDVVPNNLINIQVYRNPEDDRLCAVTGSEAGDALEKAGWTPAPISFASTLSQVQDMLNRVPEGVQETITDNPELDAELQQKLMKLYDNDEERMETISDLVRRGASITRSMSMVRVAADTKHGAKNLEILLELGGSVQDRDKYGSTPLHIAAVFCNADVAEILLKNGADIEAKDDDGDTPTAVLEKTIQRNLEMEFGFGSEMPPEERQRQDKIKELFDQANSR